MKNLIQNFGMEMLSKDEMKGISGSGGGNMTPGPEGGGEGKFIVCKNSSGDILGEMECDTCDHAWTECKARYLQTAMVTCA